MSVRVRYAPSPTGHLHIGGARTALSNYLFAKSLGGQYILRIEDTDLERNVEGADLKFLNNFKWLGLQWDEGPDIGGPYGPYRCMDRLEIYRDHLDELLESKKAYHKDGAFYLRVNKSADLSFTDMVRGDVNFDASEIDDFVIVKSNGVPVYNFAVVVDDYLMRISHVIRGEEHLSNTPRQLLIYDAFGWEPPQFGHVSLILGKDGKKLSKRDETVLQFIEQYRDLGYLPDAIINYLVLLGWSPKSEQEIFSKDELTKMFSFDGIQKAGAKFDQDKMTHINYQYMKHLDKHDIVGMLYSCGLENSIYHPHIVNIVDLFKNDMRYVAEFNELAKTFFENKYEIEALDYLIDNKDIANKIAQSMLSKINDNDWSVYSIKLMMNDISAETELKGKLLMMTTRALTTGQLHGKDLILTLCYLTKETVKYRLLTINNKIGA